MLGIIANREEEKKDGRRGGDERWGGQAERTKDDEREKGD